MNYKIIISEGCTAFYTEINGKMWSTEYEPAQMSLEEKNQFIDHLLSKLKEGVLEGSIDVDSIIKHLVEDDVEYDDHVCDQCGDTVTRYIWNI